MTAGHLTSAAANFVEQALDPLMLFLSLCLSSLFYLVLLKQTDRFFWSNLLKMKVTLHWFSLHVHKMNTCFLNPDFEHFSVLCAWCSNCMHFPSKVNIVQLLSKNKTHTTRLLFIRIQKMYVNVSFDFKSLEPNCQASNFAITPNVNKTNNGSCIPECHFDASSYHAFCKSLWTSTHLQIWKICFVFIVNTNSPPHTQSCFQTLQQLKYKNLYSLAARGIM